MKLTKTGYRITRNGNVITSVEKDAQIRLDYVGEILKVDGQYFYFNRKQGNKYIYLP